MNLHEPAAEVRKAETPDTLTTEAQRAYTEAQAVTTQTIRSFQRLGRLLCRLKDLLPHGRFEGHVRVNFEFGLRRAQQYMAIYRDKRLSTRDTQGTFYDQAKAQPIALMEAERGLKLIAGVDVKEEDDPLENENTQKTAKDPLKEFRKLWDKAVRWIDEWEKRAGCPNSAEGNEQRERLQEWREWMEALYRSQR